MPTAGAVRRNRIRQGGNVVPRVALCQMRSHLTFSFTSVRAAARKPQGTRVCRDCDATIDAAKAADGVKRSEADFGQAGAM